MRKHNLLGLCPSVHYYKGNIIKNDQGIKITGKYKIHPILKIIVLLWENGHLAFILFTLVAAFFSLLQSVIEGNQTIPMEPLVYVGFSTLTFLLAFFLFRLMYIGDNPKHVIDYMSNIGLKPEL